MILRHFLFIIFILCSVLVSILTFVGLAYFGFIESASLTVWFIIHYGLFIALTLTFLIRLGIFLVFYFISFTPRPFSYLGYIFMFILCFLMLLDALNDICVLLVGHSLSFLVFLASS